MLIAFFEGIEPACRRYTASPSMCSIESSMPETADLVTGCQAVQSFGWDDNF